MCAPRGAEFLDLWCVIAALTSATCSRVAYVAVADNNNNEVPKNSFHVRCRSYYWVTGPGFSLPRNRSSCHWHKVAEVGPLLRLMVMAGLQTRDDWNWHVNRPDGAEPRPVAPLARPDKNIAAQRALSVRFFREFAARFRRDFYRESWNRRRLLMIRGRTKKIQGC